MYASIDLNHVLIESRLSFSDIQSPDRFLLRFNNAYHTSFSHVCEPLQLLRSDPSAPPQLLADFESFAVWPPWQTVCTCEPETLDNNLMLDLIGTYTVAFFRRYLNQEITYDQFLTMVYAQQVIGADVTFSDFADINLNGQHDRLDLRSIQNAIDGSHHVASSDINRDGINTIADEQIWFDHVETRDGDSDADNDVDHNDFLAWQQDFGATIDVTPGEGDFDRDGDVDGNDFLVWQHEFGSTSIALVAIPEPSTFTFSSLLILTALALARCQRRSVD